MKDRIVWGGCALLFGCGFVWGKISSPAGFFKVDNIHDLFEMAGAVATVIAASAAVMAINSWRSQFTYGEKYKAVRDFHAASQLCWDAYWYVSKSFDLIPEAWANKNIDNWYYDEIDKYQGAMDKAMSSLHTSYVILQHHLSDDELNVVLSGFESFMKEISYGCSESVSYRVECCIMIEEPRDRYSEFMLAGMSRLDLIRTAMGKLRGSADKLFLKYGRSE
ncbi:hypothetical protein [Pseudomonas chlororaphis]|uniref:hypothetical protein n=1 Tax=Pseudomonas chlororaphis TaxID=587753 RepID=UPI0023682EE7|nr:hypothetical protein [Pseudomonas chlororaphis]WDH37413.1 hypothetical protein PUP62_11495 [Pseudomonas chlororaphis]WDH43500.1 hypothetical protein PUP51_11500 [Pseudomonas chlororaphis]